MRVGTAASITLCLIVAVTAKSLGVRDLTESVTLLQQTTQQFRLRSTNYPEYFWYRPASAAEIAPIQPSSVDTTAQAFEDKTTWNVINALSGNSGAITFCSKQDPNSCLRHRGFELHLDPRDTADLYLKDASFFREAGLTGEANSFSLRSVNYPDRYLRHSGFRLYLHPNDGSDLFRKDSTFFFITATSTPTPTHVPTPTPTPLTCSGSSLVTSAYPAWQYDTSACASVASGSTCQIRCFNDTNNLSATATCTNGVFTASYPNCPATAYGWGLNFTDMTCQGGGESPVVLDNSSWQACVFTASTRCFAQYIAWTPSSNIGTCRLFKFQHCRQQVASPGTFIFTFKGNTPGFTPTLVNWTRTTTQLAGMADTALIEVDQSQRVREPVTTYKFQVFDRNCYDSVATRVTWGWRIAGTPITQSKPLFSDTTLLSSTSNNFVVNVVNLTDPNPYKFKITVVTFALDANCPNYNTCTPLAFGGASPDCASTVAASNTTANGAC